LKDVIKGLQNPQAPTSADRTHFWDRACLHFREGTSGLSDSNRREFKRSLIYFLNRAFPSGALCASEKSLKRRFEEKLSQWSSAGESITALQDRRFNSGRIAKLRLCGACCELMAGGVRDLDGDREQAWQRLRLGNGKTFCAECIRKFQETPNVPKTVRRQIAPMVEAALPWRRGPRYVQQNSPCVRRDWSDTAPGDSTVYDDGTPDHAIYGKVELPLTFKNNARFGTFVGRMELLLAVDERTDYPKAFLVIVGEPAADGQPQLKAHYNQVHQRLLLLREHDKLGLPRKQAKFENGPWRNRLNDGERIPAWDAVNYVSFANGLADTAGIRIRHTQPGNARSKIVERVFNAVWRRMKCHPGYLGNNERLDKREVTQDFIARVKRGAEDPRNGLLSVEDYIKVISEEMMEFAKKPQSGDRLPGCSPLDAWMNGIDGHAGYSKASGKQLFGAERFLLASHERVCKVDNKGITIGIGGSHYFWGEELLPYKNETLICRFNLEHPEVLSCREPQPGGKIFTVQEKKLPANTATPEEKAEVARQRRSWTRQGKVLYDRLPHPFISNTIAKESEQPALKEFAQECEHQVTTAAEEAVSETREQRKVIEIANDRGLSLDVAARHPKRIRQADSMRKRAERLREEQANDRV
jgi:hypothetical protein